MLPLSNYEVYIFDCDGVILNSNQLKIDAMEIALKEIGLIQSEINECKKFFSLNFGMSRFYHIDYFSDYILKLDALIAKPFKKKLLILYSRQCKELYLEADLTLGFLSFVDKLKGNLYVASGSEQNELQDVFRERNLDRHFQGILGSPTPKVELVASILKTENGKKGIMFGDALSDMHSAFKNSIDFVAYLPYSNVKKELKRESSKYGFLTINSWGEI